MFNVSVFNAWSCSMCYVYLFPSGVLIFNFDAGFPELYQKDGLLKQQVNVLLSYLDKKIVLHLF